MTCLPPKISKIIYFIGTEYILFICQMPNKLRSIQVYFIFIFLFYLFYFSVQWLPVNELNFHSVLQWNILRHGAPHCTIACSMVECSATVLYHGTVLQYVYTGEALNSKQGVGIDFWFVHFVMICAHVLIHYFHDSPLSPIVNILVV